MGLKHPRMKVRYLPCPPQKNKKKKKGRNKKCVELSQAAEGSRSDRPTSVAGSNPVVNLYEIVKKTGLISWVAYQTSNTLERRASG